MINFQLYRAGMSHVVHIDTWFAEGTYYAQSASWINNGVLLAATIEELATSIEAVIKGVSAKEILTELRSIHAADD